MSELRQNVTALYVRVSTDSQFEEGYSVDAQIKKLRAFCEIKDYNNVEEYIDGGWSGSNLDRPGIKRLISDIESHIVKRVVVYKLDRLSRSQKDTLFILEDVFLPNEIDFISISENFDTSTPYGKAMIGILSVFAQLERENIRDRTRLGMYERVKSGKWMGGNGTPFGYDYDAKRDTLVPNANADDVRKIYDLYLQGYSTTKLAEMFPVSSDRQITNILDRVTYLGKISYNGEVFDGNHEPIIDEDTYNRVQAERRRRSTKNAASSNYLLAGFLVCGKCGAKMRYQKWGRHSVKIYCYSQQSSKKNLIKNPACDNMRYDSEEVERVVLEDFFAITDAFRYDSPMSKANQSRASAADVIEEKKNKAEEKLKRLYDLYAEDGNPILLKTIEENKSELKKLSQLLENERASIEAVGRIVEEKNRVRNIRNRWDSLTMAEKRRALSLAIDRIVLTDNAVDIKYLI